MCQYDTLVIICLSCIELDALQPSCPIIPGVIIIARAQALSSVVLDTLSWANFHRCRKNIAPSIKEQYIELDFPRRNEDQMARVCHTARPRCPHFDGPGDRV
jgi:hypothetical protein